MNFYELWTSLSQEERDRHMDDGKLDCMEAGWNYATNHYTNVLMHMAEELKAFHAKDAKSAFVVYMEKAVKEIVEALHGTGHPERHQHEEWVSSWPVCEYYSIDFDKGTVSYCVTDSYSDSHRGYDEESFPIEWLSEENLKTKPYEWLTKQWEERENKRQFAEENRKRNRIKELEEQLNNLKEALQNRGEE